MRTLARVTVLYLVVCVVVFGTIGVICLAMWLAVVVMPLWATPVALGLLICAGLTNAVIDDRGGLAAIFEGKKRP